MRDSVGSSILKNIPTSSSGDTIVVEDRVSKKHDVTVVNKPFITLQQQFPAPKFRPSMESQTNVVYKIPCTNCSWCYIGELVICVLGIPSRDTQNTESVKYRRLGQVKSSRFCSKTIYFLTKRCLNISKLS